MADWLHTGSLYLDQLISFFQYNPGKPLMFTQIDFWFYFFLIYTGFTLFYKKIPFRNAFVFLVSLFFYYKSGGLFVLFLLFSILFNYVIGFVLHREARKTRQRVILILSVIINLSFLVYYKYAYFFTDLFNHVFGTSFQVVDYVALLSNNLFSSKLDISLIINPVGISFFTFHALSYLVDIYRKDVTPVKSLVDFGFYLSFFPQLVMGPIIRASVFVPQIGRPFIISKNEFGHALFLILSGLIKKMVVSDYISINFVDRIFDNPGAYTGFENLMGVYGYAIQIYCDFSGYTDIAIGLALLMGIRVPINFHSPYKATSLTDFWRRWHISLSSWLRDYLYIPLGGNRKGKFRENLNLMITMFLGGLWHGASLSFIGWGVMHGVGLVVNKIPWLKIEKGRQVSVGRKFLGWLVTFHFVCLAWILFRAENLDTAKTIVIRIFSGTDLYLIPQIISSYSAVFLLICFAFLFHWLPDQWKETYRGYFIEIPLIAKMACILGLALFVFQIKSSVIQPFIYFQF